VSVSSAIFPSGDPAVAPVKKKRVLLIDTSRVKRDLRLETMRKLGVEVDCAADISEARCWWRADLYDLVLIHVEDSPAPLEKFCNDLRSATPPQQIMFLVGSPDFLAASPATDQTVVADEAQPLPRSEMNIGAASNGSDGKPQRWGLLEACRRISAIRSVCDARARAIRNTPEPRRDSETSRPSRILDPTTVEFLREELQ
jgi:CheY-like chemotaxis protein